MKALAKQFSILLLIVCLLGAYTNAMALEGATFSSNQSSSLVSTSSYSDDGVSDAIRAVSRSTYETASSEMAYSKAKSVYLKIEAVLASVIASYDAASSRLAEMNKVSGTAATLDSVDYAAVKEAYDNLVAQESTLTETYGLKVTEGMSIASYDELVVNRYNELVAENNSYVYSQKTIRSYVGDTVDKTITLIEGLIDKDSEDSAVVNSRNACSSAAAKLIADDNFKTCESVDSELYASIVATAAALANSSSMSNTEFAETLKSLKADAVAMDSELLAASENVSESMTALSDWNSSYTDMMKNQETAVAQIEAAYKAATNNAGFVNELNQNADTKSVSSYVSSFNSSVSTEDFVKSIDEMKSVNVALNAAAESYTGKLSDEFDVIQEKLAKVEADYADATAVYESAKDKLKADKETLKKNVTTYNNVTGAQESTSGYGDLGELKNKLATPLTNKSADNKTKTFASIAAILGDYLSTPVHRVIFASIVLIGLVFAMMLLKAERSKRMRLQEQQVESSRDKYHEQNTTLPG